MQTVVKRYTSKWPAMALPLPLTCTVYEKVLCAVDFQKE